MPQTFGRITDLMRRLLRMIWAPAAILVSCDGSHESRDDRSALSPKELSLVDEVYGLSQDLDTDGFEVTVRGWLHSNGKTNEYRLYNAAWDPFEPQTKKGVSYIVLNFEDLPSDFWIGQYTNVAGQVVTERKDTSDRIVTLVNATIVSTRIRDGEPIPFRIQEAEQDSGGDP
jgi:hypothetical protein